MKEILFDLGHSNFEIRIPEHADILRMGKAIPLSHPEEEVRLALKSPIECLPLKNLVEQKLLVNPAAKAVVVISDNTRPVPYSGKAGILYPIVNEMMKAGIHPSRILILVSTGTHRAMGEAELKKMLDPRVLALRFQIINHDCRNAKDLISIGITKLGGKILINRHYIESDIKILTGLVESHFMAGASGGRKSICPGLLSESSTHILHSGPVLASSKARDLILKGNPVHEEALRVAKLAGCDMIVNVTLDSNFRLTGVFAGNLERAHLEAVKKLMTYAAIPVKKRYDIALTHTSIVGVNHYQAAKGALICAPILKDNGICILAAHHTEPDPIGGSNYKAMMRLLGEVGTKKFLQKIQHPSWVFIPEQWEAQMWTRIYQKIPYQNLIYCSLEIPRKEFAWLPETDGRTIVPGASNLKELVEGTLNWAVGRIRNSQRREPQIAVLPDGPYGITVADVP